MAKGRFIEDLVHGVPMYPFSSTPDGRTVAELHRAREDASEYHDASLALQNRSLAELADIHKGQQRVPKSDLFNSEASLAVLGNIAGEMRELYASQALTNRTLTDGFKELGEVNTQGFNLLHDDLQGIRGPTLGQVRLTHRLEDDQDLIAMLAAHSKGIINERGSEEITDVLTGRLRCWAYSKSDELKEELMKKLHEAGKAKYVEKKWGKKELVLMDPEVMDAFDTMRDSEGREFFNNPERLRIHAEKLAAYGRRYQIPDLESYRDSVVHIFDLIFDSKWHPITETFLISLANNGILNTPAMQLVHQHHPKTRRNFPSVETMNHSLVDIVHATRGAVANGDMLLKQTFAGLVQGYERLKQGAKRLVQGEELNERTAAGNQQRAILVAQGSARIRQEFIANAKRDITNDRLLGIMSGLRTTHEDSIDLRAMLGEFAGAVERDLENIAASLDQGFANIADALDQGFERVDAGLTRVQNEVALTREAVTATLKISNRYLDRLVDLATHSHENNASQHLIAGHKCLSTAEKEQDLEDAYAVFKEGIQAGDRVSYENYFGAGFVAQLLGKAEEAVEHFRKAAIRSGEDKGELKEKCYQSIAEIEHGRGNVVEALRNIGETIKINPDNLENHYLEAKYLALLGFTDEAILLMKKLVASKEDYYLKMRAEPAFKLIKVEKLREFWKVLLDADAINSPKILVLLLEDMLATESFDLASAVFFRLLETKPGALIDRKIWLHPGFNKLNIKIIPEITAFIETKLASLSAENCYSICALLHYCGATEISLLKALKIGLEQDLPFYSDNKQEAKQKLRAKLSKCMGNEAEAILRKLKKECGNDLKFDWIF